MSQEHKIQAVCNILANYTIKAIRDGQVPSFLNIDGSLALMQNKIFRYFKTKKHDEIIDLAIDAIIIATKAIMDSNASPIKYPPDKEKDEYSDTEEADPEYDGDKPYSAKDLGVSEEDIDERWKSDKPVKKKKVKKQEPENDSSV